MRRLFLFLALAVLTVTIVGCGSHSSQTITTGGDGSLEGVQIIPRDGDRDVPVDTWIRVYWPRGYDPPVQFTFRLRVYRGSSVSTYKHNSDQENDWQFEPASNLSDDTRYIIELEAGDESDSATFWTGEEDQYARPSNIHSDAGPRVSEALEEHKVQTAR